MEGASASHAGAQRATRKLAFRPPRNSLLGTLAGLGFWVALGAIGVLVLRTAVLLTVGHDIFDRSHRWNKIAYATGLFIGALLLWSNMSIEGVQQLGRTYNRKLTREERKLVRATQSAPVPVR